MNVVGELVKYYLVYLYIFVSDILAISLETFVHCMFVLVLPQTGTDHSVPTVTQLRDITKLYNAVLSLTQTYKDVI